MFQDGQLFTHLTVARNVGYALRLRHSRRRLAPGGGPAARARRPGGVCRAAARDAVRRRAAAGRARPRAGGRARGCCCSTSRCRRSTAASGTAGRGPARHPARDRDDRPDGHPRPRGGVHGRRPDGGDARRPGRAGGADRARCGGIPPTPRPRCSWATPPSWAGRRPRRSSTGRGAVAAPALLQRPDSSGGPRDVRWAPDGRSVGGAFVSPAVPTVLDRMAPASPSVALAPLGRPPRPARAARGDGDRGRHGPRRHTPGAGGAGLGAGVCHRTAPLCAVLRVTRYASRWTRPGSPSCPARVPSGQAFHLSTGR